MNEWYGKKHCLFVIKIRHWLYKLNLNFSKIVKFGAKYQFKSALFFRGIIFKEGNIF